MVRATEGVVRMERPRIYGLNMTVSGSESSLKEQDENEEDAMGYDV